MAFLNTDEIGDIDSLTSEQREENARNLDAIESLDDVYKTYRPLPRKYWLSSSSTSTLKAVQYANTVESIECNQLQEAIAKTDITSKATDNNQAEETCYKENKDNNNTKKEQSKKKSTPPPVPPRPSRSPRSAPAPLSQAEEIQENPSTDTDKEKNVRIASGEMTKMQSDESGYELSSSIETQNSYSMNSHQMGHAPRMMDDHSGQMEMIASDYYAQQLAMQMSNPLYSYGGYGQSQLMSGGQSYQFHSPESDYFNYAQLGAMGHQLQSISNYGQYSSLHGLPDGSFVHSDGSGFSQLNQFPYMTGGGGKRTDSGECNCSSDESSKTQSDCSGGSESAPSCGASDCCPANPNSCYHSNRCCPDDERAFEMPESMACSMPQCRVGRGQCPASTPLKSPFSFVDVNPMRGMEMPCCSGMPSGPCGPCCMPPPPPPCCSAPAPFPCECMPCCPPPPPPQCQRMPCCSAPCAPCAPPPPPPPCGAMPCCSPTPECCACSGNCLNIEGFLQRIRAAQQRQCCCYPQEQYCCGDDRLQSHTVYTADYQPFCGCGNKFNHFPKCDNCGSCGSRGSCASCMGCCPTACGAASGGCCQMPYESPCCTLPPGCAAPYPATCSTPCYRPCAVPCLSEPCCPPPCASPTYPACCTPDSCYPSCPMPCEMPPTSLCGGSSPIAGNVISKATSCNLTQCDSFS